MTIRLLSRALLCIGGILLLYRLIEIIPVLLATVPRCHFTRFVMIATVKIYHVVQNCLDRAQLIQDNLSGVRVIRAFDREIESAIFSREELFGKLP